MTDNEFNVNDTVFFESKTNPYVSGEYKVKSIEHTSNSEVININIRDNVRYHGWLYNLDGITAMVIESSLSEVKDVK